MAGKAACEGVSWYTLFISFLEHRNKKSFISLNLCR
jgi:hypothetical protein